MPRVIQGLILCFFLSNFTTFFGMHFCLACDNRPMKQSKFALGSADLWKFIFSSKSILSTSLRRAFSAFVLLLFRYSVSCIKITFSKILDIDGSRDIGL